jgi:Nucleotidyl transferase AbiEii toxin, Type IV TA system
MNFIGARISMAAELLLRALKDVWVCLEPLRLPMAVMGGLALAAWKHVRTTRDVDVLIALGQTSPDAMLEHLVRAGMRPKRMPPIQSLGSFRLLQILYEPSDSFLELQVDLMFADSAYQQVAIARRVPLRLPIIDTELSVLACEDLILHKLLAGRIVDRADASALLRANRAAMDFDYLIDWVNRLALTHEWSDAWNDAFPGDRAHSQNRS